MTKIVHPRNTEGLRRAAETKHRRACDQVEKALQRLVQDGCPINFNVVATRAHVSKAFLYREYRHQVEELRPQTSGTTATNRPRSRVTDAGKDVIIAAKDKRIAKLERKVKDLRQQLERLHQTNYEQPR